MTLVAVTGAGGFLGRATVTAATAHGVEVRPIYRALQAKADHVSRSARYVDLRDASLVTGVLTGVDVLIHLAAAKAGSFHDQYPSTVVGTQNLLTEAARAKVRRVVLVSSFAVYDYEAVSAYALLDEEAPVDYTGVGRDAYAQTKTLQEAVATTWRSHTNAELVIARPGVVYGSEAWWSYRVGERFGRLCICFGSGSQVPLSHVANCASALAHLALRTDATGVFNVFDEAPTQREYRRFLRHYVDPSLVMLVFPWKISIAATRAIERANERRRRPLRLPSFLVPQSMALRAKPLRYSNERLRDTGWAPTLTLREAFATDPGRAAS